VSKFIFDGPTLSIEGDPLAVVGGVFQFTAQELYSEWVDWTTQGDNLKYPPAFSTAGGDSLGGGTFLGAYVFIRNDLGWRGVPPDIGNVQVVIDGNFYPTDPNLSFFVPWPLATTVIQSRVSQMTQALSTTGTPAPTANENAAAMLAAAQVTPIHADIQKVNNIEVTGIGTELNPWGPV
jgi:hypothetical protein